MASRLFGTIASLFVAFASTSVHAQSSTLAQTKAFSTTANRNANFTGKETQWTFKLRANPKVHRSVVVLSDVIDPVTNPLPAWKRLSSLRVGLMPVEGRSVVIERDRLTRMIESYQQTANHIEILGSKTCVVEFQPQSSPAPFDHSTTQQAVAQASYERHEVVADAPPPDVSTKARVDRWIKLAVQRFAPSLHLGFDYKVPLSNHEYQQLAMMTGVIGCRLLEDIDPNPGGSEFRLELTARMIGEPMTLTLKGEAWPHPQVVVSKRMIGRGMLLTHADVELRPVPGSKLHEGVLTRLEDAIGKETRGNIRAGTVVQDDEIGEPILVHRGDLIELTVRARGVKVTTAARAISGGPMGELIQVETTQQRERLVARVAGRGFAEILTRTPVTR